MSHPDAPFCYDWPRMMVTVDAAVCARVDGEWRILLIERGQDPFAGRWALPGGFVDMDEELDVAALRELDEETGVRGVVLEQMATFGTVGRDPRGRSVSVVYAGITDARAHAPAGADDAADARWFPVADPPPLAFDHADILSAVRTWLAARDAH